LAVDDLKGMINGYRVSQAIYVAATLGIADLLKDGPRTSDELAAKTGTDLPALYRLLRALAAVGVLHEDDGRRFDLTPLGDQLRSDHPESLGGWAAYIGRSYYWDAWGHLLESVRTGENAFRLLTGSDVWSYRAEHPEESAIFDRAMVAQTGASNRSVIDAYDFGRFKTVCDVGGGYGSLLASLLERYPTMQGILFDQRHVVTNADDVLRGVADRCRVVAGSFFESVPQGGDAYLLRAIIHDWEDEQATEILRV
jgi:O-methyltransferase domain/Dimerisation domain